MNKIWLMAVTTYQTRVRSGAFLILTFGVPLLMVIAGAIPLLREMGGKVPALGYVDQTGQLAEVRQVQAKGASVSVVPYTSQEAARQAYLADQIGGYLVIPEDYFQGTSVQFYAAEDPTESIREALTALLRQGLLPDAPPWALERLAETTNITFRTLNGQAKVDEGPGMIARIAVPVALSIFFILAVLTSTGQMGAAIMREKEQRSMEMIITSLPARDLVIGKVLGMALLTMTQVGIWLVGAAIAGGLALASADALAGLSIPWEALVWAIVLGVPGYLLFAMLAAGLGVIAGSQQQAQQFAGLLGFLSATPFYVLAPVMMAPNGPAAIALTLFPLTGPAIAIFRMAEITVPVWQLLTSLGIILVSLAGSIWLVTHIFRAAMLMYGQSLKPRQILEALRRA